MPDLTVWKSPLLANLGYAALFFGRDGGASREHLASLNLGNAPEEDPVALRENERLVLDRLGVPGLYLPQQVHGKVVDLIASPCRGVVRGRDADAVCTRVPDLAVGVLTADCVPILIGAEGGGPCAVVHAGWRGLIAGIIRDAVERFVRAFGFSTAELAAAIGPAIGPRDYEVSKELGRRFLRERVDLMGVIWPDRAAKPHLDLRLIALKDLLTAGVPGDRIEIVGPTTTDPALFSHRRDRGRTGRQLSAIAWPSGRGNRA